MWTSRAVRASQSRLSVSETGRREAPTTSPPSSTAASSPGRTERTATGSKHLFAIYVQKMQKMCENKTNEKFIPDPPWLICNDIDWSCVLSVCQSPARDFYVILCTEPVITINTGLYCYDYITISPACPALQMFCLQTNTQRIPAQSVSRGQVQSLHGY